ncbi:MAG: hypothetical protein ACREBV_07280 [Candidatus Zixiibacteriota bacterium]
MKNSKIMMVAALSLSLASAAFAGDRVRNNVEKTHDRQDIRQDRAAIANDQADLDRLSDLVMQYNELSSSGSNESKLKSVKAEIAVELRRDMAENHRQVVDAKKETAESKREIRSDRREIRSDRREVAEGTATPKEKHELRDDRRDRRDDRRDYRDDRADMAGATALLEQKRTIAVELRNIQREIDARGASSALNARQSALLNDYLITSRKEISMGLRELKEDKRELREDRRETREDRRQSN